MKLLTKEIRTQLVKAWETHQKAEEAGTPIPLGEHVVYLKLFNPGGAGTWLITELCEEDNVLFGFCHIHEGEWGYVSLAELESFRGRFGLGIERDLYWTPVKVKDCQELKSLGYVPLED